MKTFEVKAYALNKIWYEETYSSISSKFKKLFGFDLVI